MQRVRSGLLVVLWASVLPAFAAEPAAPRVLRVGLEEHSEPFTFTNAAGQHTGFAFDLLQAVVANQQLEVEYVMLPWSTLLDEFKAGRIDIICNVVDTPEREAYICFSATTIHLRGAVYTRREAPPLRTTADLAGRSVATVRNSRAHEYLRGKDWGVDFVFFDSLLQCVDAVQEGRADLFIATQVVSDYQIRQRGHRNLVAAPLELPGFGYREHFGVQPGETRLLARLNEGLMTVQRNGTYDRLYEKWIGPIQPRVLRWRDVRSYALPLAVLLLAVLIGLAWQRRMLARVTRQAEALRRSEEQLSLVIEGSQDGFWDWDLRTGVVTRSPRWAEMLGYRLEEVPPVRGGFNDLIHPEDRTRVEMSEKALWLGDDRFQVEFRMRAKSGGWVWILDRGKVVARDPATGEPRRLAGTHTDITARKVAEQENEQLSRKMLETQKLESLGVLAGGIAHDFNNLLTIIMGNASLALSASSLGAQDRERMGTISTAARRAADLCRQLLAYAGKGAFVVERLDLNRVTRETARLLELSVHTCTLEFRLADNLPAIKADASQLQQIVMNLVLNGAEAVTTGPGRIQVATAAVTLREGDLPDALPAGSRPVGSFVMLEVSDNGSGMSPEVLARIFDPFFTTKFTGRGLGLAAVIGIVRSHGGALTVQSEPGRGSVFRVYLPAVDGPAALTLPEDPAPVHPVEPGRVLVADDEDSVRRVIELALTRAGYEVAAVASGDEAVGLFNAAPDHYQLAVLDITMPGLDGLAALRQMRLLRPGLPCVILSGHSEQEAAGRFGNAEATTFLQKPFELPDLHRALTRVRPRS